jgi:hypothetical protein
MDALVDRLRRCDRCGGAPRFQVLLASGRDLLFCVTHAQQHGRVLTDLYVVVPVAGALVDAAPR